MPILHTQYEAELQQPDGTKIQVSAQFALIQQGPIIQVVLGLAQSFANQLVQQGHSVPNPVSGQALVDTGASVTCIDDEIAQSMGLPVIDVVQMTSASHASTPANVYPVQLQIVGTPIRVEVSRGLGAILKPQNIVALIGRDFLQHCAMFYNGPTGQLTLSI